MDLKEVEANNALLPYCRLLEHSGNLTCVILDANLLDALVFFLFGVLCTPLDNKTTVLAPGSGRVNAGTNTLRRPQHIAL